MEKRPSRQHGRVNYSLLARRSECLSYVFERELPNLGALQSDFLTNWNVSIAVPKLSLAESVFDTNYGSHGLCIGKALSDPGWTETSFTDDFPAQQVLSTRRNYSRLHFGSRTNSQCVFAIPETTQILWCTPDDFCLSKSYTLKFRKICMLSAQRWFRHQRARVNTRGGKKVPSRKGVCGVVSMTECVASTMRAKFCSDVFTSHCVHVIAIFLQCGFLHGKHLSCTLKREKWISWPKTFDVRVFISWVWCLWC